MDVNFFWNLRVLEQGLYFGCEHQKLAAGIVVQRLDPHAIARKKQPAPARIPDGERKHAAEFRYAFVAEFLVCVDDGFGPRPCREPVSTRDQVLSQVSVIVDLTVEDDRDRLILVENRLRSAAEIDDAEPTMAKSDVAVNEATLI